jgi:hypothetical protein
MKRNISALLSFLLLLTITASAFETRSEVKTGQAVQTAVLLSDTQSDELVGRGGGFKQFLFGVGCGVGIVATVAGFAGGAFTGGLSAALSGMVLAGATATACAEVM